MMGRKMRNNFIKYSSFRYFLIVLLPVLLPAFARAQSTPAIHFGTLPVVQALPLFVAAEKRYLEEEGISVELEFFNSAMEKDVALTSGQIAGYFGDIMTPMILNANGIPVKMVVTLFNTPLQQRMFAIMASPRGPEKKLSELVKAGMAGSSNTVTDYITLKILESQNIPINQLNMIEVKSIPI